MVSTIDWPSRPIFFFFNIDQEQVWNQSTIFPTAKQLSQLELIQRQEVQLMFAARSCDTVLLLHEPDRAFLSYLILNGLKLPKIRVIEGYSAIPWDEISRNNSLFIPYIMTIEIENTLKQYGIATTFGDAALIKNINNKLFTRSLAKASNFRVTDGYICKNVDELISSYNVLTKKGFDRVVLKTPYGSSGKGLRVIDTEQAFLSLCKYIGKRSEKFELLLEGWHTIERSINSQLWIDSRGSRILTITEQQINENAVYMGTDYTPNYDSRTILHYKSEMYRLGRILWERGYRGIAGIDSIVDKDGMIYPIIEINARFTQVTYLLQLVERFINNYRFISSKWVGYTSSTLTTFDEEYQRLTSMISVDIFIYTYAKTTIDDKNYYRIFLLLMSNDEVELKKNLEKINLIYTAKGVIEK